MSASSAPLIAMIRRISEERGYNVATLAERAQIPRKRLRQLLDGTEPMLVDELMQISTALELTPAEFGLTPESLDEDPPEITVLPGAQVLTVGPWDPHTERLIQVAFQLGCDFLFTARTELLAGSGVPASVLKSYQGREFPIRLEAEYHKYNDPKYDPEGLTLTLSFDAIYTCHFPWESIRQVVFFPEPPAREEPKPAPTEKPSLRLV